MTVPITTLTHLHRADGSATYTHAGYTIIGAVNGPVEVSRRDEIPDEATIEVNVRPAIGVGTPKERRVETLLHNTLKSIVLVRSIPRTLVQITLQVKTQPEADNGITNLNTSLLILPHLLHTVLLALLSASIPLSTTLTSVLVAIPSLQTRTEPIAPIISPSSTDLARLRSPPKSLHVFAFSGDRRLLLAESEGSFAFEEWDEVCEAAEEICCSERDEVDDDEDEGGVRIGDEDRMEVDGAERKSENLHRWLREVVKRKVEFEQRWKGSG